ncbi:MAG: GNAT family N-acetyltransferase [Clostridia bacterium]|nr:GNAT family N-acetyltransferase [Clostridia bacterium]
MQLIKAAPADLNDVCRLFEQVIRKMNEEGIGQWNWGEYPNEQVLKNDIDLGQLYISREEDGTLQCAVCINEEQDPEYAQVNWLFGVRPGLFHRLAINTQLQGRGLGRQLLAAVEQILTERGCDCLRCDTYSRNKAALHTYDTNGMRHSGTVRFPGREEAFVCFEKPLTADCPLLPLRMHPASRGGSLTPWGGDKLTSAYGKQADALPLGESLEVSCLPGLESRDDMGKTLPELLAAYGSAMAGSFAGKEFPLLLKLIDAASPLSVQVHPDDAYARANEQGKLGKTEAWLIVEADPDAELVYGVVPGTTKQQLREAGENGPAISVLLRRVKVKPGDVCFIPAGCVHAIGKGITLYEIQQSSDITYRFYDWDRTDAEGRKRPLHIKQALDVVDVACTLQPVRAEKQGVTRVLDEDFFTLDVIRPEGSCALPKVGEFAMLTALTGDMAVCWHGSRLPLKKGETCFIPCTAPALWVEGDGMAAVSMPKSPCLGGQA